MIRRQIVSNLLTGWVSIFVRAVVALALVPFLLSQLGREGYGLIGILVVLVSLSQVADLGLRQALSRELSELVAFKDVRGFNELASSALVLYVGIAILLAIVNWLLAPWFVEVFKVGEALRSDATWMVRIYGTFSILISFITPVFSAGLGSHHRFDLVNLVQVVAGAGSGLSLFVVLSVVENQLFGWLGVMLVTQAVALGLNVLFFRKYCAGGRVHWELVKPSRLRPLFKLGGYMYVLQMTRALSEQSDPIVISSFFGPTGVALYQPGGRLSTMVRPVVTMVSDQLLPLATRSHVCDDRGKQLRILYDGTRFILLLGALFSIGLGVFADSFCQLWLGQVLGEDYRIAATIMMSWAVVDFTTYIGGTSWSITLGMGVKRLRPVAIIRSVASLINIAFSVWLVGFTSVGIPGVLVATIATGIVLRPVFIYLVAGYCKITVKAYFYNAHVRGLLVSLLLLPLMIGLRMLVPINSYLELGLVAFAGGMCWAGLCWMIGLKEEERVSILSAGLGYLRKFKSRFG